MFLKRTAKKRVITAWVSALTVPFLKNSPWSLSVLFFSNPWSTCTVFYTVTFGQVYPYFLYTKDQKKQNCRFPNREFPLSSVYSWSRGSTPFTALNVGRRGWKSCPCPMLRLHLWEVRALCIPFIHWPDKWVIICVLAPHIEVSLYPSHDINTFLKLPCDL